jgi:hypothetical protein
MLLALRTLANKLGHIPTWNENNADKDTPSSDTYLKRFGSFYNALLKAGLVSDKIKDPRMGKGNFTYTDEEMIDLLKSLSKKLGRTPTVREICPQNGVPSYTTYLQRFGSLKNVLMKAGLTPNNSLRNKI